MRPIVQYWHSSDVPAEVRELTATFRDQNPDLPHLMFHEPEAEDFIAEHFTSRELAAFRACAVPAMQADYFRCCAILALGGIYADVGLVCLRPLSPLLQIAERGFLVWLPRGKVIYNGFFAFGKPGHPFLRLVLDVATANIERRVANAVNQVTGPWVFTCIVELHRMGSMDASWAPNPAIAQLARAIIDEIGDYDRIVAALEGVSIEPTDTARQWAFLSPVTPAYKSGPTRWGDWPKRRGSIFR